MHEELLSICIPTFNRGTRYLLPLLSSIADQITRHKLSSDDVRVYISDNASPDKTQAIGADFAARYPGVFHYSRNQVNTGGNANIIFVRTLGTGRYRWVLGDDEVLCENALPQLLVTLRKGDAGLILAFPTQYEIGIPTPHQSATYREFVRACAKTNPHALAEHTLISCNIYRDDCFDQKLAEAHLESARGKAFGYPHMFGLLSPLNTLGLPVIIPEYPIISLQPMRTSEPNSSWSDMDALWVRYFTWIKEEMKITEFDPTAPSRKARGLMIADILRNPFLFLWSYRWELVTPRAWRFFFRRLFLTSLPKRLSSL